MNDLKIAIAVTFIVLATGLIGAEAQVCDPSGPQPQEACFPSNPAPPSNPNQGDPAAPDPGIASPAPIPTGVAAPIMQELAFCEATVEQCVTVLESFDRELRSCHSKVAKMSKKRGKK